MVEDEQAQVVHADLIGVWVAQGDAQARFFCAPGVPFAVDVAGWDLKCAELLVGEHFLRASRRASILAERQGEGKGRQWQQGGKAGAPEVRLGRIRPQRLSRRRLFAAAADWQQDGEDARGQADGG